MCTHKSPKPIDPNVNQAGATKEVIHMRNSYLDGLGINSETTGGRNSLRIDMASAPATPSQPTRYENVNPRGSMPPITINGVQGYKVVN